MLGTTFPPVAGRFLGWCIQWLRRTWQKRTWTRSGRFRLFSWLRRLWLPWWLRVRQLRVPRRPQCFLAPLCMCSGRLRSRWRYRILAETPSREELPGWLCRGKCRRRRCTRRTWSSPWSGRVACRCTKISRCRQAWIRSLAKHGSSGTGWSLGSDSNRIPCTVERREERRGPRRRIQWRLRQCFRRFRSPRGQGRQGRVLLDRDRRGCRRRCGRLRWREFWHGPRGHVAERPGWFRWRAATWRTKRRRPCS